VLGAAAAERVAREVAKKSKAAFTLRLDNDRHLRLRLASAVTNRSAQMLVTEALDAFLESLGEVEALARQVGPVGNRG
jgi:predicted DNA-binding protein